MSELDVLALEANFEAWRKERVPSLSVADAFERFAIEQTLKDADLSDDEVDSGLIAGGGDGGIDGAYFFINRTLMLDDTEVPDPAMAANLAIIQAKNQNSFGETTIQKIEDFTRDLLDWSKPVESLTYLNADAKDFIRIFREKYTEILAHSHQMNVDFYYVTKSDDAPNANVTKRAADLCDFVRSKISIATVDFNFLDCRKLLTAVRAAVKKTMVLEISRHFNTPDNSVVCLVKLTHFAAFLTDEHGQIGRSVLEPNVRDYQGASNPVNRDIRQTLQGTDDREFWWFNNGITILANQCFVTGDKLSIEQPEIVNGLQTSQEIFSHFRSQNNPDDRSVMIRVIVPPDAQTRNRITKATNFQTQVQPVMLHATDPIHFDIEDRLRLHELFYDRRKGEYRQQRKPIHQIVSITALAQAVIAIILRRPDDARARPGSLLRREETYGQIFENNFNRDVFVAAILIDRQVLGFLETQTDLDLTKDIRRDIRYYVDSWVSSILTKRAKPSAPEIAAVLQTVVNRIPQETLRAARDGVLALYRAEGATDAVSKSPAFTKKVLSEIERAVAALEA